MTMSEGVRAALADRYVIERELGRGGMAVVYLARDLRHDRSVALKLLLPELAASLGPERFQREIRFAARLQHPHVLTVLDSGEAAGQLWFTMPFVEGESLRDRLRRERQLPVEDAIRIATEAARALDYAHHHGVIHRDIKPENILLTADGSTLVADFGIARALGDEALTQTGFAVGTPAYMSPEQAAGDKSVDARTDVYALGAVLYEMLAGDAPFTGATAQAIIARRLTEPPPSIRSTRASVPEAVDLVIRKALATVPADRFAGAAQMAQALTQADRRSDGQTVGSAVDTTVRQRAEPSSRPPFRHSAFLALVLGLLIGGGILFAWRYTRTTPVESGERRIAVLPFQNLGDSADAYFADGITDAIRGKLTALPTMRVIASNSSAQYRNTTKSPQEIGRELGVDYLLVGKVRWARAGGTSRVQVSPELIEVATADAKWQQPFDAALTDVFQVQADVAGEVAQALDVAIGSRQQQELTERPTANLAAYDAYLKGQAIRSRGPNPSTLRTAIEHFEQAVALDSTFAEAWAELSGSSSSLYSNGMASAALADRARTSAERALALKPGFSGGYRALAGYYRLVVRSPQRALELYAKGRAQAPNDSELLRGQGLAEVALGRWEQAVENLRRSQTLDPRSAGTAGTLADALTWLRRYPEAMEAVDRALALNPSSLFDVHTKMLIFLAQGDLAGARTVLAQPPPDVDLPVLVAYVATYWDTYWALNDEQRALAKRLTEAAYDGDRGSWGLVQAGLYSLEGDARRAAAYGDSARVAYEQQLNALPDDPQRHVLLGVALAYMGRKDEAIKEGRRGVALMPLSSDAQNGPYFQHQLARIYTLVGEPEQALDQLEPLLRIPYFLSPGWLRIDPTFASLRKHPRFQRLVERKP